MCLQQSVWSSNWLEWSQDARYEACTRLWRGADGLGVPACFSVDSLPYLMSTEHPWKADLDRPLRGSTVLSVAGSGDVPLYLSHLGARTVVAVDISRAACYLNELKAAACIHLSWEDFLRFFLAGIGRASCFLRSKSLPKHLSRADRLQLYGKIRAELSSQALSFWDSVLCEAMQEESPFERFLHTTDLVSLEQIPYVSRRADYELWRRNFAGYPILNLPLEVAIGKSALQFDLLYFSNVLEYMRTAFLMESEESEYRLYLREVFCNAVRALKPGGVMVFYLFESPRSVTFADTRKDLELLYNYGMEPSFHAFEYTSSVSCQSRFRNMVVSFRKNS